MCGRSLETIFGIVVVFKKTVLIMCARNMHKTLLPASRTAS